MDILVKLYIYKKLHHKALKFFSILIWPISNISDVDYSIRSTDLTYFCGVIKKSKKKSIPQ